MSSDPGSQMSCRVRLDGIRKQALETGRNRLLVTGIVMSMAFLAIGVRLIDIMAMGQGHEPRVVSLVPGHMPTTGRADIVDRHGIILATSLPTASLYADPREIIDVEEAANKLARAMPILKRSNILSKLKSPGRFVWLRRNLTPRQQYEINRLGIPGLSFQRSERRVYPHGTAAAHVLGLTDIDGRGIAGIEKYFDQSLTAGGKALRLSIDLRIQDILLSEIKAATVEFDAIGAAGLVLDVNSGEVLAMVSLPDFDPNVPKTSRGGNGFNRVTKGVYEMGSTFKLFNTAMALDSGTVSLDDSYDVSKPIRVSRFTISDFHNMDRRLSVQEVLIYSSNIGSAKMAVDMGSEIQRDYLGRMGLLGPTAIELPEVGMPLMPSPWRKINTMTISYGHGIAVSPLQLASAVVAIVNGGMIYPVTLLDRKDAAPVIGKRVISAETSKKMRAMMRLVVSSGTGKKANAQGYIVGGKTGTAEKQGNGRYRKKALISSFVAAFPMDAPRYVVLVILDEPKGNKKTFYYATGGWVAAPAVRRIVRRMAPLVGLVPAKSDDEENFDRQLMASADILPSKIHE